MEQGLDSIILDKFAIYDAPEADLSEWDSVVEGKLNPEHEVTIAMVGKYMGSKESYKSLSEALVHGGIAHDSGVKIEWIEFD